MPTHLAIQLPNLQAVCQPSRLSVRSSNSIHHVTWRLAIVTSGLVHKCILDLVPAPKYTIRPENHLHTAHHEEKSVQPPAAYGTLSPKLPDVEAPRRGELACVATSSSRGVLTHKPNGCYSLNQTLQIALFVMVRQIPALVGIDLGSDVSTASKISVP